MGSMLICEYCLSLFKSMPLKLQSIAVLVDDLYLVFRDALIPELFRQRTIRTGNFGFDVIFPCPNFTPGPDCRVRRVAPGQSSNQNLQHFFKMVPEQGEMTLVRVKISLATGDGLGDETSHRNRCIPVVLLGFYTTYLLH
jgi:hypothetical protein